MAVPAEGDREGGGASRGRGSDGRSEMQSLTKEHAAKGLRGAALDIKSARIGFDGENYLTEAGHAAREELGWPNTYTLTKSLAESLIGKVWQGASYRGRASGDCRNLVAKPFLGWLKDQYIGVAVLFIGTYFRQLPSNESKRLDINSSGAGLRWDDSDSAGNCRAAARRAVSVGNIGDESLRYGTVDRVNVAGAPQALPGAGGSGILAAVAVRCDFSFEDALSANVGAGAKGNCEVDPTDHVAGCRLRKRRW